MTIRPNRPMVERSKARTRLERPDNEAMRSMAATSTVDDLSQTPDSPPQSQNVQASLTIHITLPF